MAKHPKLLEILEKILAIFAATGDYYRPWIVGCQKGHTVCPTIP